jgi:hypothetical protein
MAYTVSNRQGPHSHGSLKRETGEITSAGAATTIVTKLGRILYFQLQSMTGTADNGYVIYLNSASESAVADDPGTVYITATLTNEGLFTYEAYGY